MKYGITLGYSSKLNKKETIEGIDFVSSQMWNRLKEEFELLEAPAASITDKFLWLNDDARGSKRSIDFDNKSIDGYGEILQTNNKWRRYFMYKNDLIEDYDGIISQFTSIQRDVKVDNISSIAFEELGIEITRTEKDLKFLSEVISKIFSIIFEIDKNLCEKFPQLEKNHFGNTLTFVTYKKLREIYPLLSFRERINRFAKDNGAFVIQDYVERTINQDSTNQFSADVFDFKTFAKIYYYHKQCEQAVSMGYVSYQVDRETFKTQNTILKEDHKSQSTYNYLLVSDELPLTLSCGLYINRIMMGFLEKEHIAEIYSSIWNQDFVEYCNRNNINIL